MSGWHAGGKEDECPEKGWLQQSRDAERGQAHRLNSENIE